MQSLCLSFSLLLGALNLTYVPIPVFDEIFLGAHAFNLTCTDVVFGSSGADWATNRSLITSTTGGTLHCHSNLTVYAYDGLVHADIIVDSSNITLTRNPLDPGEPDYGLCFDRGYSLSSCVLNASLVQLYTDPPSRLIDMMLSLIRSSVNDRLQTYVCDVIIPQIQQSLVNDSHDFPRERDSAAAKRVFPLPESHLVMAAYNIFEGIMEPSSIPHRRPDDALTDERVVLHFKVPQQQVHFARSLVEADADETAVGWLQGVVDDVVSGTAPQPFPVLGLHGEVANVTLDYYVPQEEFPYQYWVVRIVVDVTMESCDANSCEVYLNPGLTVAQVRLVLSDSIGMLVSHALMPRLLPLVNRKIDDVLRAMAVSQQRNVSDANATVRVSFGKKAVLRQRPKAWPLALIFVCAVLGGAWMVWRNVRLHALQPVLCSTTGEPVTATRLVLEDVLMVAVAAACLMLFAASNTMTGASVLLGEELNTYSFSMWNTVTDLWKAGLIPLSICVFVFSGIYPYVKLLSLVYYTVWAQRPLSKRLALIDVVGKFSFIDTFALMVMVSGLEIQNVARVVIHWGFYYFMFATVASIALGNYATTRYRRGTSHRVPEQVEGDTEYARAATQDSNDTSRNPSLEAAVAPTAPSTSDPDAHSSDSAVSGWRRYARRVSVVHFLVVHLCSLPSWKFGCMQYTVGGFARLFTPTRKTLSLWQLSLLNKWGRFTAYDAMVPFIFAVAFFTILLAPCIFALVPRRAAFLASWCAADVFIVACVAGLLQLHQFITFVLGSGMDDIYTAHATLRWPMVPLTVASLVVWYLIARYVIGVKCPVKQRL